MAQLNNPTLLRFESARWMERNDAIDTMIIGAGSTGSQVAYLLSKQVDGIIIYEHDDVEIHNCGTQLYAHNQVGKRKASSLETILKALSNVNQPGYPMVSVHSDKFDRSERVMAPYVFACVDNIVARRLAFNSWCRIYGSHPDALFVDIRMAGEDAKVFFVNGNDLLQMAAYRASLDGEFTEAPCTLKLTVQMVHWATGIAVQGFNNYLAKRILPPYEIILNGPLLTQIIRQADESITIDDHGDHQA